MIGPWSRNEGRFDRPSSLALAQSVQPASYIERRVAAAKHDGIVGVGADTILQRIDDAIRRCKEDGLGNPKAVYLTEVDLVAFTEAHGALDYKDVRVSAGASSKVYARGGSRGIRKRPETGVSVDAKKGDA